MSDQMLLGELLGDRRKEEGIALVSAHGGVWIDEAMRLLRGYVYSRKGEPFTMDMFRRAVAMELPNPHHVNAWGALTNSAAKAGLIKKTGEYFKSTLPASHNRMLTEWVGVSL